MHPKAGILALNGALPMKHITGQEWAYRVRWHKGAREQQLSLTCPGLASEKVLVWDCTQGSSLGAYTPITWEEIPDELMDELPMSLIEAFLKTQP